MTSVDEKLPEDKEKESVNNEVETNEEIQIENKPLEQEEKPIEEKPIEETPTEFCEEIEEKTKERVQKLFECPKCHKMLTKKTLNYYHECTKNDVPKAKRRPKKIIVKDIEPPKPEKIKLESQTNQIIEQGEKFLKSLSTEEIDYTPKVEISYEDMRRERIKERIQQRSIKIKNLFSNAI